MYNQKLQSFFNYTNNLKEIAQKQKSTSLDPKKQIFWLARLNTLQEVEHFLKNLFRDEINPIIPKI
jgi:hypothetical protein